MNRFLIVDDHPLFREALQSAVRLACPESEVCEATTIANAVMMIEEAIPAFDLVLLDLTMPGTNGFEGLLEVRTRFPQLPVMVVSSLEDSRIAQQALAYGVAGYVPKSSKKSVIAAAINTVLSGSVHLPDSLREARIAPRGDEQRDMSAKLATLTPQQLRVLQMLRQGLLNKQIAYELQVGETTVKAHVSEILRKLNVYSRTQAVIEVSKLDNAELFRDQAGF